MRREKNEMISIIITNLYLSSSSLLNTINLNKLIIYAFLLISIIQINHQCYAQSIKDDEQLSRRSLFDPIIPKIVKSIIKPTSLFKSKKKSSEWDSFVVLDNPSIHSSTSSLSSSSSLDQTYSPSSQSLQHSQLMFSQPQSSLLSDFESFVSAPLSASSSSQIQSLPSSTEQLLLSPSKHSLKETTGQFTMAESSPSLSVYSHHLNSNFNRNRNKIRLLNKVKSNNDKDDDDDDSEDNSSKTSISIGAAPGGGTSIKLGKVGITLKKTQNGPSISLGLASSIKSNKKPLKNIHKSTIKSFSNKPDIGSKAAESSNSGMSVNLGGNGKSGLSLSFGNKGKSGMSFSLPSISLGNGGKSSGLTISGGNGGGITIGGPGGSGITIGGGGNDDADTEEETRESNYQPSAYQNTEYIRHYENQGAHQHDEGAPYGPAQINHGGQMQHGPVHPIHHQPYGPPPYHKQPHHRPYRKKKRRPKPTLHIRLPQMPKTIIESNFKLPPVKFKVNASPRVKITTGTKDPLEKKPIEEDPNMVDIFQPPEPFKKPNETDMKDSNGEMMKPFNGPYPPNYYGPSGGGGGWNNYHNYQYQNEQNNYGHYHHNNHQQYNHQSQYHNNNNDQMNRNRYYTDRNLGDYPVHFLSNNYKKGNEMMRPYNEDYHEQRQSQQNYRFVNNPMNNNNNNNNNNDQYGRESKNNYIRPNSFEQYHHHQSSSGNDAHHYYHNYNHHQQNYHHQGHHHKKENDYSIKKIKYDKTTNDRPQILLNLRPRVSIHHVNATNPEPPKPKNKQPFVKVKVNPIFLSSTEKPWGWDDGWGGGHGGNAYGYKKVSSTTTTTTTTTARPKSTTEKEEEEEEESGEDNSKSSTTSTTESSKKDDEDADEKNNNESKENKDDTTNDKNDTVKKNDTDMNVLIMDLMDRLKKVENEISTPISKNGESSEDKSSTTEKSNIELNDKKDKENGEDDGGDDDDDKNVNKSTTSSSSTISNEELAKQFEKMQKTIEEMKTSTPCTDEADKEDTDSKDEKEINSSSSTTTSSVIYEEKKKDEDEEEKDEKESDEKENKDEKDSGEEAKDDEEKNIKDKENLTVNKQVNAVRIENGLKSKSKTMNNKLKPKSPVLMNKEKMKSNGLSNSAITSIINKMTPDLTNKNDTNIKDDEKTKNNKDDDEEEEEEEKEKDGNDKDVNKENNKKISKQQKKNKMSNKNNINKVNKNKRKTIINNKKKNDKETLIYNEDRSTKFQTINKFKNTDKYKNTSEPPIIVFLLPSDRKDKNKSL